MMMHSLGSGSTLPDGGLCDDWDGVDDQKAVGVMEEFLQPGIVSRADPPSVCEHDCTLPVVQSLEICKIRKDGQTQHRSALQFSVIAEYAALMRAGVKFPPIRVWFDGADYWLSDGFQRVGACERIGVHHIKAEIHHGGLSDAQWDSYHANSTHGLRRTRADLEIVIRRALDHPKAATLSTVEIAKHLNLPEVTVRRWRRMLSSSYDEDKVRVVSRGKSTYLLKTADIGYPSSQPHS